MSLLLAHLRHAAMSELSPVSGVKQKSDFGAARAAFDPKRTRQMIRLADGVVFDYVVPIFNMVTSTAKDSNGA